MLPLFCFPTLYFWVFRFCYMCRTSDLKRLLVQSGTLLRHTRTHQTDMERRFQGFVRFGFHWTG